MKVRIFTFIFSLMLSCSAFADEPRVYMRTTPSDPSAGQEMTLEVLFFALWIKLPRKLPETYAKRL